MTNLIEVTQGERYRHLKRGTEYEVIAVGELQMARDLLCDGSEMVVYKGDDGRIWVREEGEFLDGRFALIEDLAQVGTHPKGGDSLEAPAPLSDAVGTEGTDAPNLSLGEQREELGEPRGCTGIQYNGGNGGQPFVRVYFDSIPNAEAFHKEITNLPRGASDGLVERVARALMAHRGCPVPDGVALEAVQFGTIARDDAIACLAALPEPSDTKGLVDALEQAEETLDQILDDMSGEGQCVCLAVKNEAIETLASVREALAQHRGSTDG